MNLGLKVRDVMKPDPLVVGSDASLGEVASKMARSGRDVVVVQEGETVLGLVTASEIFFAVKSFVLGKSLLENTPESIREMRIAELLSTPKAREFMEACGLAGPNLCVSLGEGDSVEDAIRVMAVSGLDHILVVGEKGVAGTLSEADLLKVFQ